MEKLKEMAEKQNINKESNKELDELKQFYKEIANNGILVYTDKGKLDINDTQCIEEGWITNPKDEMPIYKRFLKNINGELIGIICKEENEKDGTLKISKYFNIFNENEKRYENIKIVIKFSEDKKPELSFIEKRDPKTNDIVEFIDAKAFREMDNLSFKAAPNDNANTRQNEEEIFADVKKIKEVEKSPAKFGVYANATSQTFAILKNLVELSKRKARLDVNPDKSIK